MYLYATGKNHRRVNELAWERNKEFKEFITSILAEDKYSGLKNLPSRHGRCDFEKLTKEQRDLIASYKRELIKKAHSLEGILRKNMTYAYLVKKEEEDAENEIGSWRNEWPLHHFIIDNFGDPKNDNLTEVYLDEAALKKIIENYNGNEEYCEPFRLALYIVKGGGVVYYWPWY